jgi:hypothetical protein
VPGGREELAAIYQYLLPRNSKALFLQPTFFSDLAQNAPVLL